MQVPQPRPEVVWAPPVRPSGLGRTATALVALAALGAWLALQPTPRPSPTQPSVQRVLEPIASGRGVAVLAAPGDGGVYWVRRHEVVRVSASDPTKREVVASLAPPWRPVGHGGISFTAAHVDPRGRLWLGMQNGELVVRDTSGHWLASFPAIRSGRAIDAIATRGDEVFVAAGGLWRGELGDRALHPIAGFGNHGIANATARGRDVAIATRDRVWLREGDGWRQAWRTRADDQAISTLRYASDGALWIGTHAGLVRLARDGTTQRDLEGVAIDAISESRSGVAYVGTDRGLFTRYTSAWRRVGAAGAMDVRSVDALAVGTRGALWVAAGERGLFRAGGR